jgi:hypothetical protein
MSDDTYECWIEDDGRDSARTVKATDPDFAAQDFARDFDWNGDYWFLNGNTAIVCVARPGSDDVKRFDVYGESEPVYYANEVKTEGSR